MTKGSPIILFGLLIGLAACAQSWTAAIRFEGGASAPQVPLVVRVMSSRGEQL